MPDLRQYRSWNSSSFRNVIQFYHEHISKFHGRARCHICLQKAENTLLLAWSFLSLDHSIFTWWLFPTDFWRSNHLPLKLIRGSCQTFRHRSIGLTTINLGWLPTLQFVWLPTRVLCISSRKTKVSDYWHDQNKKYLQKTQFYQIHVTNLRNTKFTKTCIKFTKDMHQIYTRQNLQKLCIKFTKTK